MFHIIFEHVIGFCKSLSDRMICKYSSPRVMFWHKWTTRMKTDECCGRDFVLVCDARDL